MFLALPQHVQLIEYDFKLISEENASPIILTIELPRSISSVMIGELLYFQGYQLHFESEYLQQRNWMQISCIDNYSTADLEKMTSLLKKIVSYEFKQSQKSLIKPFYIGHMQLLT